MISRGVSLPQLLSTLQMTLMCTFCGIGENVELLNVTLAAHPHPFALLLAKGFEEVTVAGDAVIVDVLLVRRTVDFGIAADAESACRALLDKGDINLLPFEFGLAEAAAEQVGWDAAVLLANFYVQALRLSVHNTGLAPSQARHYTQRQYCKATHAATSGSIPATLARRHFCVSAALRCCDRAAYFCLTRTGSGHAQDPAARRDHRGRGRSRRAGRRYRRRPSDPKRLTFQFGNYSFAGLESRAICISELESEGIRDGRPH